MSDQQRTEQPESDLSSPKAVGRCLRTLFTEINGIMVDYFDIKWGPKLGEGVFSEVYRCTIQGREFAVKQIKLNKVDIRDLHDFRNEIQILNELEHPNIIRLCGATRWKNNLCILTSLQEKGTLGDMLERRYLTLPQFFSIAKDIASGLAYLHENGIIHRDLKPDNVFLDSTGRALIGDFGLAHNAFDCRCGEGGEHGPVGTPVYMAPEVLDDQAYGFSADIFSLGMVLCEMFTGSDPIRELNVVSDSWDGACREVLGKFKRNKRPDISGVPNPLHALISQCWHFNAEQRPSAEHVYTQLIVAEEDMCPEVASARRSPVAAKSRASREDGHRLHAAALLHARPRGVRALSSVLVAAPPSTSSPSSPDTGDERSMLSGIRLRSRKVPDCKHLQSPPPPRCGVSVLQRLQRQQHEIEDEKHSRRRFPCADKRTTHGSGCEGEFGSEEGSGADIDESEHPKLAAKRPRLRSRQPLGNITNLQSCM